MDALPTNQCLYASRGSNLELFLGSDISSTHNLQLIFHLCLFIAPECYFCKFAVMYHCNTLLSHYLKGTDKPTSLVHFQSSSLLWTKNHMIRIKFGAFPGVLLALCLPWPQTKHIVGVRNCKCFTVQVLKRCRTSVPTAYFNYIFCIVFK